MDERIEALRAFRQRHQPRRTRAGGVEWSYYDLGAGGCTLVFLHGLAGAGDIWFQQLEAFAPRCRVLAPSYPPLGTLAGLAAGVWAVLDAASATRAVLVGSSLGGLLAQYLVADRPERVEKAVFGNTFPPGHPQILRGRRLVALARFLPEKLVLAMMWRNAREKLVPVAGGDPLLATYLYEQYRGVMRKADVLARSRAVFETFETAAPPFPHAIFEAANDPLIAPPVRRALRELYPRAWVHTFGEVGHFPYLSHAGEYNRALKTFLHVADA